MKDDNVTTSKSSSIKGKHATNRDVARLAGVSVATVSYVINGKENQKISEETKKKVFQAMNFLNYIPNPYAVGLNTKQPNNIMIRTSKNISHLSETELLFFLRSFNLTCEENGYSLNYSMSKNPSLVAASACVCYDMPDEEFHAFAAENFVPVIAVHSLINDPVFYQITLDYNKVFDKAVSYFNGEKFTYIAILPQNEKLRNSITSVFPDVKFVSTTSDLKDLKDVCKNVVLTQQALFDIFKAIGKFNVYEYAEYLPNRNKAVLDSIAKALDRLDIPDTDHFICL